MTIRLQIIIIKILIILIRKMIISRAIITL